MKVFLRLSLLWFLSNSMCRAFAQEKEVVMPLNFSFSPMLVGLGPERSIIHYFEGSVGKRVNHKKHFQGYDIGYFSGHLNAEIPSHWDSVYVYRAFGPSVFAGLHSPNSRFSLDSRVMFGIPGRNSDINAFSMGVHFRFYLEITTSWHVFTRYSHVALGLFDPKHVRTLGFGIQVYLKE